MLSIIYLDTNEVRGRKVLNLLREPSFLRGSIENAAEKLSVYYDDIRFLKKEKNPEFWIWLNDNVVLKIKQKTT